MSNEIRIQLTTKQTAFDRAVKTTENVFYGGAKGGGKSFGLREIMLKRRFEYPGSFGVIFRKTYPELYGNHIDPLLTKFPILRDRYNNQNKELKLENGSVLAFRHCQYERDLGLHQGQEYNDLAIDEVGEWPEHWFWTLKGSNRSGRAGVQPRSLLTGNPGGLGHKWLKRLFVDRHYREVENPKDFAFVQARVHDNPALMMNDPNYINRLKANKSEMMVKAYLEGSWDISAGQFFDMVSRETHMIEPFDIPEYWERFGAFDTGYNHPAGFLWFATDTDGVVYVYREYCRAGRRTEEIVKDVMEFQDSLKLRSIPSGHDSWSKHGGGPSVEEKFTEHSQHQLVLQKAAIDRVPGAQQVRDYLVPREKGPMVRIFKTCPILFDTLTRMTHDPKNPEDVLKVDATDGDPWTGDELYDCLRMGLMDRPRLSQKPPEPKRRRYFNDDGDDDGSWTTV